MSDEKQVTLTFTRERETKRTIRFAEDGNDPKIGTLYINKSVAANWQTVTAILAGK